MLNFKILTIPFDKNRKGFDSEILEKFTGNKKIKEYRAELIKSDDEYLWTLFITYEELEGIKLESKLELSEADKILLEKLKIWRSESSKTAGVPSYVVAKNEHLLELVKRKPKTLEEMRQINGIGEKKLKEYGEDILKIIKDFYEVKTNERPQ